MNLLTDAWIPVRSSYGITFITLKDVLTSDDEIEVCLYNDDLEFYTKMMLSSIVQRIHTPTTKLELRKLIHEPISEEIYDSWITEHMDSFVMNHRETPLMQMKFVDTDKKKLTSASKLMPNSPDCVALKPTHYVCDENPSLSTKKAHFNSSDEYHSIDIRICPILLYVKFNTLSFGGRGYRSPPKGDKTISMLVNDENLRKMIWSNVLTEEYLDENIPDYSKKNNTLHHMQPSETVKHYDSDIVRTAFSMHTPIELIFEDGVCTFTNERGTVCKFFYKKADNLYEIIDGNGIFDYPYNIITKKISKEKEIIYDHARFDEENAGLKLMRYFVKGESTLQSHNIKQFNNLYTQRSIFDIAIGGYMSKQGVITNRIFTNVRAENTFENFVSLLIETDAILKPYLTKIQNCSKNKNLTNLKTTFIKTKVAFIGKCETYLHEKAFNVDDDTLNADIHEIYKAVMDETMNTITNAKLLALVTNIIWKGIKNDTNS